MNTSPLTQRSPQPGRATNARFAALALALLMSCGTLSGLHALAADGVPAAHLARASSVLSQA